MGDLRISYTGSVERIGCLMPGKCASWGKFGIAVQDYETKAPCPEGTLDP